MSDKRRSSDTGTEKEPELEIKRTSTTWGEAISGQTSREQGTSSSISAKISNSPYYPQKRRTTRQPSDDEICTCEKKTNLELQTANFVPSSILQSKNNTSSYPSEKQEHDLQQNQTSFKTTSQSSNRNVELVQPQEQVTRQEEEKSEIKSSISRTGGEISTTSKSSYSGPHLIEFLLKNDYLFRKDKDGDTILHLAIVHKNVDIAIKIIETMVRKMQGRSDGIDIKNQLRQTPLHLAVLTCQPRVVKCLVEHGADVNVADRNGHTALHLACKNADVEDIRALRARESIGKAPRDREDSIDVNLKNYEGLAPIHLATLTGSCEVIDQLLDMGADINLKLWIRFSISATNGNGKDGKSGRTALHHAVEAHNPIVARFLLLKDANVNAQTFAGNTPLHTVSGRHMDNITHILLEFGADRKLTNFEGALPIPETYLPYSLIKQIALKSKESKK